MKLDSAEEVHLNGTMEHESVEELVLSDTSAADDGGAAKKAKASCTL